MSHRSRALLALTMAAVVTAASGLHARQPDPRQMSGVPLPVADLPAGTVTVRVIRGALTNPIASQTVEIAGAGASRTANSRDSSEARTKKCQGLKTSGRF